MASLRVKPWRSVGEFRDCRLGHGGGGGRRRRGEGFVNYTRGNDRTFSRRAPRLVVVNRSDWDSGTSCSGVFNQGSSSKLGSLATAITGGDYNHRERRDGDDDVDIAGKLDFWVKESVFEILNNLEEAPFLVHIYSDSDEGSGTGTGTGSGSGTRLVRERASAESWPLIKGRWGGGNPAPTGIILVEEMKNKEEDAASVSCNGSGSSVSCSSNKVWGILIQGKGVSCPACYILKTSRVGSVLGCCTHFCLVRVECFYESVDIQLKKLWLV